MSVITLREVRAARREIGWAAARRWRERQAQRQEGERKIAADGAGAADSPERCRKFAQREAVRRSAVARLRDGTLPRALERMIGPALDMSASPPNEAARMAGRPVARIVVMPDGRGDPEAIASGFLVTPRLLITNHHVLPTKSSVAGLGANFLHDQQTAGAPAGVFFELKPDDFYLSDPTLDFALVAISTKAQEGNSIEEFGAIPLIEATPKILVGHPVNIVQYPEGGVKHWAYTQNQLLDVMDNGFLHYTTDTMRGSSGSPAFNKAWELVALHHAGVPEIRNGQIWSTEGKPWDEEMNDEEVSWIANEGARVSAIVGRLAAQRFAQPAQQALLDQLLKATSDPLAAVAGSVENSPVQIPGLTSQTNPMTNNVFNFSGPVTIHIHGDSGATIATSMTPAIVAGVEASIRFDRNYAAKKGYQENFLGLKVPLPTVNANRSAEILQGTDGKPLLLKYRHYSLVMNRARRLQMWSAVNVDYSPEKHPDTARASFGSDNWIPDPRIPGQDQIVDKEFYKPAKQIDRGHIVRREDNAWGDTLEEIEFANSDTYHWTNCTPQHEAFNKEHPNSKYGRKGLWGAFESHVEDQLLAGEKRCCILAGPVLAKNDPVKSFEQEGPIAYPVKFWKVIAVVNGTGSNRKLKTYGFVFDQSDVVSQFGIEFAAGAFSRYQKKLSEISALTGVVFDNSLLNADVKKSA